MNRRCGLYSAVFLAFHFSGLSAFCAEEPAKGKVSFSKEILPILSANCYTCHGPDDKARKAKLRLDSFEGATAKLKSEAQAFVPKDSKNSEALIRILSTKGDHMPPAESGKSLSPKQTDLLKRWIDEGAEYQKHWSFVAPQRPALPQPKQIDWVRNPIDRFILERLEKEGLSPSTEADRYALARRVAIDLTGLPPGIASVDRFVADTTPGGYERFVDEILASKDFGERWAAVWLDLARYADSNGFADDRPRIIWRYRDWVIEAINDNMPFDRFTIEQLAGDLLPNATQNQILATAFHRNTLTNDEGGTNDEEFRVAAVVDRVNTTMQVWQGLTIGCAQCHNHKYDPLSQEEYYRLFAILNQSEDADRSDNSPLLTQITPEQARLKTKLETDLAVFNKQLDAPDEKLATAQSEWEKTVDKSKVAKNVQTILAVEVAKRNDAQKNELQKFFRSQAPETKDLRDKIAAVQKQLADVNNKVVTTPIMKEFPKAQQRKTHILIRGNFLAPDREVTPGVPAVLPPLPADAEANRLTLAKWLVDSKNPLTARVTVNRCWEQIFGLGLVETPEDWGLRGKMPTHPELLDFLATEFIEQGWDLKKFLKMLVTSATYRQSSKVSPALLERDPENQLLARGPRFRSTAEVIRDQALASSGLLSAKMYGTPVRPPRPRLGLSAAFGGSTDWDTSPGDDKFRRGLYTEWRRTTPYPSMTTFDASSRNVCTISRPRTNTPLQALVTLNDPVYVEAAQALGRRMMVEGGDTLQTKVTLGFRLALTRPPTEGESKRLVELFEKTRAKFQADPQAATALATEPLGPLPKELNAIDAAAWTVVANVLLNLDEIFAKR